MDSQILYPAAGLKDDDSGEVFKKNLSFSSTFYFLLFVIQIPNNICPFSGYRGKHVLNAYGDTTNLNEFSQSPKKVKTAAATKIAEEGETANEGNNGN